jgi:hypothetical protein
MSTCEVRLFVPKGGFTAYVSGMTVADEIFCPPLYVQWPAIKTSHHFSVTSKSKCVINALMTLTFKLWLTFFCRLPYYGGQKFSVRHIQSLCGFSRPTAMRQSFIITL